jgi:outer membrane receptor for ferrienterochelin and colicin
MNLIKFVLTLTLFLLTLLASAQTGTLTGKVYNASDNQPIPFADVVLENTNYYTTTDENGWFVIDNIKPGVYNVVITLLGFEEERISEVSINNIRTQNLEVLLSENTAQLEEVIVKSNAFRTKAESPVSVAKIGITEIMRSPGANRDISFVVRNLPGVATTNAFRNDLIVRGGSPGENKFYMDGIEIPNLNHFATQGSSGGPVGMVNVNFIQNVDFYTGSFPANRGNALSSVMDITSKMPNAKAFTGNVTIGSSDFGLTLDTPTGANSGMLLSVRRSYLQFLFDALKLPFLPVYNDVQYSHRFNLNDKNQLTLLGLGAYDDSKLNKNVNDGVTDTEILERNNFILNRLPSFKQWNYVVGANWKHFTEKGFHELVLSRNMLDNSNEKYLYNIETPANLLQDYHSQEIENKFRFQHTRNDGTWKWYAGLGIERVKYTNETFQKISVGSATQTLNFESQLTFQKYALFAQTNTSFLDNKWDISLSLRTDFTDYSSKMENPFRQISPRIAMAYHISDKSKFVISAGKYYQLPAYTILGYRDSDGTLVNKENGVQYLNAMHYVAGYQYTPKQYFQLKLETFYKVYKNYPFDLNNGVSLANLGSDYGVIGNTPVNSDSNGRSYGIELSGTQKLTNRIFGSFTYTYVRSEFQNSEGEYIASAWDSRHILNVMGGYKFKRDWELGMKFRLLGGLPYTPFDLQNSALKTVWDVNQQGVLDYTQLNSERLPLTHALDIRMDKKWYFNKWALNLYLDIQNAYASKIKNPDYFNVIYDSNGLPLTSESNPNAYQFKLIQNESGNLLPSIGLMVDF